MKRPEAQLVTPIYVKTQLETAWPDDKFFYLLTANGLFLGRNHALFSSCVPARRWPSELARQDAFLVPSYPRIARRTMERIVGFFSAIADAHGSEAGVLLAWDQTAKQVRVVIPRQLATVSRNQWGDVLPIGLEYEGPTNLPATWTVIGDVHSHVDAGPSPSSIDNHDETHRAGLHIIVGCLNAEPPTFHVEAVVDGTRFRLQMDQVMEAYERRAPRVPQTWIDKVQVRILGNCPPQNDEYAARQSAANVAGPATGPAGGTSQPAGTSVGPIPNADPPPGNRHPAAPASGGSPAHPHRQHNSANQDDGATR